MILTGVDFRLEQLLDWWLDNALRHHDKERIGVWDLGMTPENKQRLIEKYPDVWFSEDLPKHTISGWFHKLHCVINAPEKRVMWLDVDCQILTDISDAFDLVPEGMIGLTRDWVRGNWWATGVICVNDRPNLLNQWDMRLQQNDGVRGDQEALYELIGTDPHEQIIELPQEYQWLRISLNKHKDSPNKKVIHWTGPKGKDYIINHLAKGGIYKGERVG